MGSQRPLPMPHFASTFELLKDTSSVAIQVTYPNGTTELIPKATRVDTQNFHEGMFDFYDQSGNLLHQISRHSAIKWESIPEPRAQSTSTTTSKVKRRKKKT